MKAAAAKEALFDAFVRAAVEQRRAPTAFDLPTSASAHARQLARDGRIRIEVSGHNWRTVTILTGPHAGAATLPDPHGRRIYRVIDTEDRVNGEIVVPPSAKWRPPVRRG